MSGILNLPSCFFIITRKERSSACVRNTFLMLCMQIYVRTHVKDRELYTIEQICRTICNLKLPIYLVCLYMYGILNTAAKLCRSTEVKRIATITDDESRWWGVKYSRDTPFRASKTRRAIINTIIASSSRVLAFVAPFRQSRGENIVS